VYFSVGKQYPEALLAVLLGSVVCETLQGKRIKGIGRAGVGEKSALCCTQRLM
jgi:hypothetical protein